MHKTNKEKVIRAATFGDLPIQTFPGSIIKKEVFFQIHLYVDYSFLYLLLFW